MQPYFLPYIGYFQLVNHCDVFVIYDDVQYSKGGWVNRNRLLIDGGAKTFTIPLSKASDFLDVRDRRISDELDSSKMMNTFEQSYGKAPYWEKYKDLLTEILEYPDRNLFNFITNSTATIATTLSIDSKILVSSDIEIDKTLKAQDRVLAICRSLRATEYINSIGGLDLYQKSAFAELGINLKFLSSNLTPYPQFSEPFVEALSIVDALMFIEPSKLISQIKNDYTLVDPR